MKAIVLLLVSFVSEGLGRHAPLAPNHGIDVRTMCSPYVQNYHNCRALNIDRPITLKAELKKNLTTSLQKCFTDNGCSQQPHQQPTPETPEETKCRKGVRDGKREKVRQCVHEHYPEYVFPQPQDQHAKKEAQHRQSLLDINADQCANKEAVIACKRNAIENHRSAQFMMKCSAKGGCLAAMPADCQNYLLEVKDAKCMCKAHLHDQIKGIRSQIPECQQVPHKPHKPSLLTCPPQGYCRAGYEYWLKDHPLQPEFHPSKSLPSLPGSGAQPAPAQPAVPQPAPPQPAGPPQQPAAPQVIPLSPPLPQQAAQPSAVSQSGAPAAHA